jgi:SAM-dependent methyltransferase
MEVGAGTRFFDAGCGAGGASERARALGAVVSGIDRSEGMIAFARRRLPDADLRLGDLVSLPFGDDSFDAVLACNSVQFTGDPVAALAEIRRVCAPGGRVSVCTWDEEEKCDHRFLIRAMAEVMPGPPKGPGPFALSPPGALEALIEKAGLRVTGGDSVAAPFVYADTEQAWRSQRSAGTFQRAISLAGEDTLKAALTEVYQQFRTDEGIIRLNNFFRFVVATP